MLVGAADWLIPLPIDHATKTKLAGMVVPALIILTPFIGAKLMAVIVAGWLLACLLLRRDMAAPASGSSAPETGTSLPADASLPELASRHVWRGGTRASARRTRNASGNPASKSAVLTKAAAFRLVTAFVLLGCAGAGWYAWKRSQLPAKAAVSDYLVKSLSLPVRVPAIELQPGASGAMGLNLAYQARFETTEPLYRRVDTMEYLRAHAGAELAAIDAAEALLKGPDGQRLTAAMAGSDNRGAPGTARPTAGAPTSAGSALNPQLSALNSLVLLTTATPAGTTAVTSGQLLGWKREGSWTFSGELVRLDPTRFVGEPRPPGSAMVFAVDLPADEVRLKAFLAEQVSYAARVQSAARELADELERERQERIASFAALLRSGTLFTGTASGTTAGAAIRITLEIASGSVGSSHVTAVLRNDGGWSDTRLFQGDWSVSSDADICTLTLRSSRADRIAAAGPLLEDNRDIAVTLQVRPDGTASGVPDNWQLRRVDPAEVPAVRAGFSRSLVPALAATKPGLLYRGTVVFQGRTSDEILMLRFTAQDPDGVSLEASLQSTTVASWVRPFRGSVIDNTYRAGSTPIRLRSLDADRIAQAPTWSMLFLATGNDGVGLNLRVEGSRLIGQDDRFMYVFEPADPSWTPPVSASAGSATSVPSGSGGSSSFNPQPSPLNPGSASAPSPGGRALPPFPGAVGAYVLSDEGQWIPLPRNNGHKVVSAVQKANDFFGWLKGWEGKIAGTAVPDQKEITGQWMFDGGTPVPVVSGDDVVVIYAGPLMIDPALLAKYPQLAMEPLMEMAPLWWLDSGVRSVPLTSPVKGLYGFGPLRVPVTLERPALAITLMHCTTKLPARHYAVACGGVGYELAVQ